MAERYNFKYLPLVGKLPGKSMVEQTETAINELASVVYDNVGYVGNLAEEVQTANTNASNALEKATEALETSGRVYIKLIAAVDVNDYYDSELYYINNDGSTNIPVRDRGFLEVKTNDDKTACEQVFIADSTGTPYYRHGRITEQTLGDETTYVVTWGSWYQGATTEYVQEEIRQHGNVPVGFEYFSMNPNVPQGSLPLFGGEYSRETYADLWAWVQAQSGYLKTEAEWQTLSTSNNGNVPFYSSGDGSTTFRVPSLQCWVRGANGSVSTVGSYLAAGLPNITGSFGIVKRTGPSDMIYDKRGAFSASATTADVSNVIQVGSAGNAQSQAVGIDASISSSIYGNSTTVQPESIVGLWLVKAYGTIVDTGTIDEQQYIDDRIAALPTSLATTFLPLAGGTMGGSITFLPHIMDSNWENISHGNSTLIFYGKKGTIESDKRISLTSFVTRDATGTDADDGFSRYSCLETQIDPSGNVSVVLFCYKDEADVQTNTNLSISYNADGTKSAKFDGKEIERINSSGSNYIRYESGWQLCFGGLSISGDGKGTVTFPVPFATNSSYTIIGIGRPSAQGANSGRMVTWSASNYTATSSVLSIVDRLDQAASTGIWWLAIGKWK